jgi:hypothetical protein
MNMHAPILTPREQGRRIIETVCRDHYVPCDGWQIEMTKDVRRARREIILTARMQWPSMTAAWISRVLKIRCTSVERVLRQEEGPLRKPPEPVDVKGDAPAREIIEAVAESYGMTVDVVMSRRRDAAAVQARHACIRAVSQAKPGWSSVQIGELFGLDHSTVLYAIGSLKRKPTTLEATPC